MREGEGICNRVEAPVANFNKGRAWARDKDTVLREVKCEGYMRMKNVRDLWYYT